MNSLACQPISAVRPRQSGVEDSDLPTEVLDLWGATRRRDHY